METPTMSKLLRQQHGGIIPIFSINEEILWTFTDQVVVVFKPMQTDCGRCSQGYTKDIDSKDVLNNPGVCFHGAKGLSCIVLDADKRQTRQKQSGRFEESRSHPKWLS